MSDKIPEYTNMLDQWFLTSLGGCPEEALGVAPISKLDVALLVNCVKGCHQIVIKPRKGAANQKSWETLAFLLIRLFEVLERISLSFVEDPSTPKQNLIKKFLDFLSDWFEIYEQLIKLLVTEN